jgi:hypothetical protein
MYQLPWFQRFIFIIFIAKWRGKINLWNQGMYQQIQGLNTEEKGLEISKI